MSAPEINIKNISKVFFHRMSDIAVKKDINDLSLTSEDKIALKNINLVIHSGETLGIIGRNGAGKSTLLSILTGIASQTDGEVDIVGKVTAVMTLGVGLREDLSGRENIWLDGEIQGKSREEMDSIMDQIIDFSELEDFIDRPVKIYSTGMKSRLAFSMLVGIEPEILIIDEALSAGDVFFAEKATKKIREICQKGKIVILVSHSMGAIDSMCTRCLWMEKGEIVMDDKPELVTKAYLKQIKEEDELDETQSSRNEVSNVLENAKCYIVDIVLKKTDRDYSQSVFYTQEPFAVEITLDKRAACSARLMISVERIDGTVLYHRPYDLSQEGQSEDLFSFLVQLSLDSLVINKGYYQIKIELFEEGSRTNYFTRFFEVKNDNMPTGGAPLLRYPTEILLVNEEHSECLDSIELITE